MVGYNGANNTGAEALLLSDIEDVRAVGVSAPILSTADNAFTFRPRQAERGWLAREWPRAAHGVVGWPP